jgi:sterol 3beta-glucosyltransferase
MLRVGIQGWGSEGDLRPLVALAAGLPDRAHDLLITSARAAKVRAIVQTKREGGEAARDGDLYLLPWAPHAALLPHCAAVLHHGGAGTTHASLRNGKPSVVLPFIFEQKLWAKRLQDVGVAEAHVSFWKATPERVAPLLQRAVQAGSMRARAEDLAVRMQGEDGVGVAARLLEALAAAKV